MKKGKKTLLLSLATLSIISSPLLAEEILTRRPGKSSKTSK